MGKWTFQEKKRTLQAVTAVLLGFLMFGLFTVAANGIGFIPLASDLKPRVASDDSTNSYWGYFLTPSTYGYKNPYWARDGYNVTVAANATAKAGATRYYLGLVFNQTWDDLIYFGVTGVSIRALSWGTNCYVEKVNFGSYLEGSLKNTGSKTNQLAVGTTFRLNWTAADLLTWATTYGSDKAMYLQFYNCTVVTASVVLEIIWFGGSQGVMAGLLAAAKASLGAFLCIGGIWMWGDEPRVRRAYGRVRSGYHKAKVRARGWYGRRKASYRARRSRRAVSSHYKAHPYRGKYGRRY